MAHDYIPLGGSRVNSNGRLYFNLALVFLLSGLWHGASWNFVIWGAFHGFFLILDRLFLKKVLNSIPKVFSILITFIITMFGWVIFRLEDFGKMKMYLYELLVFDENFLFVDVIPAFWLLLIVSVFFSFLGFQIWKEITGVLFRNRYLWE
jgi:alginate O-acetyltransferase complex protein AlgI